MPRRYKNTPIDELESLVRENIHRKQVLGEVRDELTYRTKDRARQLLKEIEGVLAGTLPAPPRPPREERPEDQKELF